MSSTKREKVGENLIRVLRGEEPVPIPNVPKGLKPIVDLYTKIYNGELNTDEANTLPPKIYFNGDITSMSKANPKTLKVDYVDGNNSFSCYASVKWQGTSSLSYAKKNFNIKLYKDEELEEKKKIKFNEAWGKESKYCLKANYIDHTHARNIVNANIWTEMVADRKTMPPALLHSPCNGAIDGFPVMLYMNGKYEGLYTLNIPKDGWMFNMNDKNPNHAVLCSETHTGAGAFRALAKIDETDWSLEYPDTLQDDIKTSFNNMITFVKDSTDEEFKANIDTYINKEALIDYYLFCYAMTAIDSLGKNMIMLTYDGIQWIPSMYDMDSTWGLYWDGSKLISTNYSCPYQYECTSSLLWERVERCLKDEMYERYIHLRKNQLSYDNIINKFEKFMKYIGKELYDQDVVVYTEIPSATTNNIYQLTNYIHERVINTDKCIKEICRVDNPSDSLIFDLEASTYTSTEWKDLKAGISPVFTAGAPTFSDGKLKFTTNDKIGIDVSSLGLKMNDTFTVEFKATVAEITDEDSHAIAVFGGGNWADSLTLYYKKGKIVTQQLGEIRLGGTAKLNQLTNTLDIVHVIGVVDSIRNCVKLYLKGANGFDVAVQKEIKTNAFTRIRSYEAASLDKVCAFDLEHIKVYNRALNEKEIEGIFAE